MTRGYLVKIDERKGIWGVKVCTSVG